MPELKNTWGSFKWNLCIQCCFPALPVCIPSFTVPLTLARSTPVSPAGRVEMGVRFSQAATANSQPTANSSSQRRSKAAAEPAPSAWTKPVQEEPDSSKTPSQNEREIKPLLSLDRIDIRGRFAKYAPSEVPWNPTSTSVTPNTTLPQHLQSLEASKGKTPRFLFRGFHSNSGGNADLNSSRIILPHAFHGPPGKRQAWPWDKNGVRISSITRQNLKYEIDCHLRGSAAVNTHFTSWAADLNTAVSYAGTSSSSAIAVLDTAHCGPFTAIYHVPELYKSGLCSHSYPEEYLVYGPVVGAAYCCCVAVSDFDRHSLGQYNFASAATTADSTLSKGDFDQANNVASLFRHESYRTAGPDLYLTMFAAQLSRMKQLHRNYYTSGWSVSWSLKETEAIISYLSGAIDDASLCNIDPLVNPNTYVSGFDQLKGMVDLLMSVDAEIRKRKSILASMDQSGARSDTKAPDHKARGHKRKPRDAIPDGSVTDGSSGRKKVAFDKEDSNTHQHLTIDIRIPKGSRD